MKLSLDVETLLTAETMGAAVPVLLCYVDLSSQQVYYVCLNDYVEKVLLPHNAFYEQQRTVTVSIPSWNVLDSTDPSFSYVWLLARRGKYYAAFSMLAYQYYELEIFNSEYPDIMPDGVRLSAEYLTVARTFLRTALRLSVWDAAGPGSWAPLRDVQERLVLLQRDLPPSDMTLSTGDAARYELLLLDGFRRGANLGRMYEEVVREWRLPTVLATMTDFLPGSGSNPPGPSRQKAATADRDVE